MTGTRAAPAPRGHAVRWEEARFGWNGAEVLHGVSLVVPAGESLVLVGPNGAGKTTLTRMVMGLVRPRSGRVTVGDWDVATKRPDQVAQRVGYAFQHADQQLFARTVRDDVAFGPRRLGRSGRAADLALDELGLLHVSRTHPWDLPAPLRKLVALAGVLAMEPGVLVLDEPTAGFDRDLRERVVAALRARVAEGVTLIAVTHDLHLLRAVARREVRLERGAVVADGPPAA